VVCHRFYLANLGAYLDRFDFAHLITIGSPTSKWHIFPGQQSG